VEQMIDFQIELAKVNIKLFDVLKWIKLQ
jgi:hypothetical protein